MKILIVLLVLLTNVAFGSIIAVIDSGTDINHDELMGKIWVNPGETPQNDYDDDANGFVDDFHGWNFAEQKSQLIDYSYLGYLTEEVKKFFATQAKLLVGEATEDEILWLKSKYADQDFIKKLGVYGNFMHGTHVAGIAAKNADETKILTVKLIPTEVKLPFSVTKGFNLGMAGLKMGLNYLADAQMKTLQDVAFYVGQHGADVANGSFGTGYPQAKMIVEIYYKAAFWRRNAPQDVKDREISELTVYFLKRMIKGGVEMVARAPKTLFVFAAGNDGLSNDEMPASPASVRASNSITVAATVGRSFLANFSNFGTTNVDVAAPGVNILSSVPGNNYLRVSGTSQAAPYVTNLAALVKDSNPKLLPHEIKKVLMETVDKKSYLLGKVKSGGIVNHQRAIFAANLSKTMSLTQAVRKSKVEVNDYPGNKRMNFLGQPAFVLPLPSQFKL